MAGFKYSTRIGSVKANFSRPLPTRVSAYHPVGENCTFIRKPSKTNENMGQKQLQLCNTQSPGDWLSIAVRAAIKAGG